MGIACTWLKPCTGIREREENYNEIASWRYTNVMGVTRTEYSLVGSKVGMAVSSSFVEGWCTVAEGHSSRHGAATGDRASGPGDVTARGRSRRVTPTGARADQSVTKAHGTKERSRRSSFGRVLTETADCCECTVGHSRSN